MPKTQHAAHIATQGSLFGQFPGNSVISARPEMNAGRVDSGWTVGGGYCGGGNSCGWLDGGPQLRLSGRGSVSFLSSRRLLFSDPSVLTSPRTDARNAAMKQLLVLLVRTGQSFAPRILKHTQTHTITSKVTVAILHFNRESWQDSVHEWGGER